MEYTKNYHLPQWEETDRIMMDDFNQMCRDMEAGIMDAREKAQAGDAQVQQTANAALAKANEAFSDSYMPFYAGSYTGTGKNQDVYVGFLPRFLIVSGQAPSSSTQDLENIFISGNGSCPGQVTFTGVGFRVYPSLGTYPQLDVNGKKYHFIAFR